MLSLHHRVSWGTAADAAATVASPEILASFVGSPAGQEMICCQAGRITLGGSTVEEEPALAR